MKRDLEAIGRKTYDVLVIGGGIYGAAVLREAALSGLSAALLEQRDFGGATSANSLKIIHGGLRYLQQLDIPRVRESAAERRALLRIAPHNVHPLPCIMPTRGWLLKSPLAMQAAFLANDLLTAGRNRGMDPAKRIPHGRLIPEAAARRILPGLGGRPVSGGAVWHDACAYDTERLVLGMIRAATDAGADAANYAQALKLTRAGRRITGVRARDMLTGREFPVEAQLVISTTGAWTNPTLDRADAALSRYPHGLALVMNLVLNRQLIDGYAAGLTSTLGRLLFFVPWRGRTLVGTYNRHHAGGPDDPAVTAEDIGRFLQEANQAYPSARLTEADVALVHAGFLPARRAGAAADPSLIRHFAFIDHQPRDGIDGLLTVVGVKYTTARDVAVRAIDLAARKLGRRRKRSGSSETVLPGGKIGDYDGFLAEAGAALRGRVRAPAARHLARSYGTEYAEVVALAREAPGLLAPVAPESEVIGAAVVHAVRAEMAQTLADVVFRRSGLGTVGIPGGEALSACAALMGRECGWDARRVQQEIDGVKATRHLR